MLVRYGTNHDPLLDWVYNGADVDHAKIVWARDMGTEQNEELLRYYSDRSVWLLDADARPPQLTPYAEQDRSMFRAKLGSSASVRNESSQQQNKVSSHQRTGEHQ